MTLTKGPVRKCSSNHEQVDPIRKLKRELSRTGSSSSFASFISSFSRQNSTLDPNVPAMSTADMIEAVRTAVLLEASISPEDFYPEDIENIKKSVFAVKRFMVRVRAANDGHLLEKSTEEIVKNLKWRKEVNILERTEETFPPRLLRNKVNWIWTKSGQRKEIIVHQHKNLSTTTGVNSPFPCLW